MEKTFTAPHWANRPITVKIQKEEGIILFTFPEEMDRTYYDIPIQEWIDDYNKMYQGRNWIYHMEEKVWFISDMRIFINENLGLQDIGNELPQDELTEKDKRIRQRAKDNGGYLGMKDLLDNQ